jgi:hypothetical protein
MSRTHAPSEAPGAYGLLDLYIEAKVMLLHSRFELLTSSLLNARSTTELMEPSYQGIQFSLKFSFSYPQFAGEENHGCLSYNVPVFKVYVRKWNLTLTRIAAYLRRFRGQTWRHSLRVDSTYHSALFRGV